MKFIAIALAAFAGSASSLADEGLKLPLYIICQQTEFSPSDNGWETRHLFTFDKDGAVSAGQARGSYKSYAYHGPMTTPSGAHFPEKYANAAKGNASVVGSMDPGKFTLNAAGFPEGSASASDDQTLPRIVLSVLADIKAPASQTYELTRRGSYIPRSYKARCKQVSSQAVKNFWPGELE
jgi:hypothetical protein